MQNTMLDSVVSSNSQELFDFNAIHNGEHCIASLDPKDRGTERQFRFTRALLCTLLGVKSDNTISNHIESLLKRGVIEVVKNLTTLKIPTNGGMQETVLYDLTVFNHLVMRLDTDKAWAMKEKFNDVLIKHETQAQLEMSDAEIMSCALEIAHRTLALREERIKALTAENAELKDAVGRGTNWHTVNMMKDEWKREFGHAPVWQKLRGFSADLPVDMQPVRNVEVKVVLKNGSEKINKVFRYHREAWVKYREYEENSRAKGKNVPDTKILDLSDTDTEVEYF